MEFLFERERLRLRMQPWLPENRKRDAASFAMLQEFMRLLKTKKWMMYCTGALLHPQSLMS